MQRLLELTSQYDSALAEKKSTELQQLMVSYRSRGGSIGE
jgi:hypothetical protein